MKNEPLQRPRTADNAEGSRCVFAARRCVPGLLPFHRLSLLILMTMPEGERRGPPFAHEHPAVIGRMWIRTLGSPTPTLLWSQRTPGTAPNPWLLLDGWKNQTEEAPTVSRTWIKRGETVSQVSVILCKPCMEWMSPLISLFKTTNKQAKNHPNNQTLGVWSDSQRDRGGIFRACEGK